MTDAPSTLTPTGISRGETHVYIRVECGHVFLDTLDRFGNRVTTVLTPDETWHVCEILRAASEHAQAESGQ